MSTIMKSLYLRCLACRDAWARSLVVSNSSTVRRWISSEDGSSMGFLQPRQLTDPASVVWTLAPDGDARKVRLRAIIVEEKQSRSKAERLSRDVRSSGIARSIFVN